MKENGKTMNSKRMPLAPWAAAGCALLLLPMACASSPKKVTTPSPDAPEWTRRSNYVDGRSMFGIGVSGGGEMDASLARTQASNRARAELSKVVETYTASLMKDYQASVTADGNASEESMVSSAVKTFSSQLLVGTEIKGYYVDPNLGMTFALAELNLDKQAAFAEAKKRLGPGLQAWVDEHEDQVLRDLESDLNGRRPTLPSQTPPDEPPAAEAPPAESAPPPPVVAAPPPSAPPPAAGPMVRPAPTGIRRCDSQRYLCATGYGRDQASADVNARAELARIFKANIQSTAESYAQARATISAKTGEDWIEVQGFQQRSIVSTDKSLRMSQILGRWVEGRTFNALVGIDRAKASAELRELIQSQDQVLLTNYESARGADGLQRLKYARSAVKAFVDREAINSDLRVVRDGRGIAPPVSMAALLSLLEQANEQLRLGVALAGPGAERMQSCLEEALTDRNYQVTTKVDESARQVNLDGDFDVLVKGQMRMQQLGQVGRSQVVQVSLTLRLINGKTNKILKSISGSQKGTRRTPEAALTTATVQLCKKKVPGMIRDIDRYFMR